MTGDHWEVCPACGQADNEELMAEIEELEAKICRLENHIMASDRIIAGLKKEQGQTAKARGA